MIRHSPRLSLSGLALLVAFGPLSACVTFPEVDAASRAIDGPAPKLIPVEGILAQADALGQGAAAVDPMQARAAALRARAARLRGL